MAGGPIPFIALFDGRDIFGVIIAVSRAIGETAPLITIGALNFHSLLAAATDPVTSALPLV
jgi:ABC-type phosphate transport system permease subunit